MRTLEIVGEENLSKIIGKHQLSLAEERAIRDIFKIWDDSMAISDFKEGNDQKTAMAIEKISIFSEKRRKEIISTIVEISFFFVRLNQGR